MGGETGGYSATESNVIGAINEIYRTYRNSYTQFSNDFDVKDILRWIELQKLN